MNVFKEKLQYPEETRYEHPIPKKAIYQEAQLKTRDQKIFTKQIEKITWMNYLKPENMNIPPYQDETRNYEEIEIIKVELRENRKLSRITDIILRTIPYPQILILEYKQCNKIYLSHIREHKADPTKITLEEIIHTPWINTQEITPIEEKLLEELKIENMNNTNMYEFYNDIINKIIIYNASKLKGKNIQGNPEEIKEILDKINEIDIKLLNNKTEINKENNYSKTVELNMKNHHLKEEKQDLINQL